MTSAEAVGRILAEAGLADRAAYLGALLAREAGLGSLDLIVVGGSAIEIYTRGGYASGDLDIVGPREPISRVLRAWGFRKGRRVWHQDKWRVVVDIVREQYNGDIERTQELATPYGNVRVAAIEDVLAKRLISAKHWRREEDFGHALLLANRYRDEIDWEYVTELARHDLATDILVELRKRVGPPSQEDLRRA